MIYPNYIQDRLELGYQCSKDVQCISDCLIFKNNSQIFAIVAGGIAWFFASPSAHPIGLPVVVRPSAVEIHRNFQEATSPQTEISHVLTIPQRLKILFVANNNMLPILLIEDKKLYINQQLLKRIRSGDLKTNLTALTMAGIIILAIKLSGTDAFSILDPLWRLNAPTVNPTFGPVPGFSGSTSTTLYADTTPSQQYNSNEKNKQPEQCNLENEFKKDQKYGGVEYKLDKNGNPIFRIETKTGSEVLLTYDQALEKYYHEDVYNLKKPKGYDAAYAKSLNREDRIEYLTKTVPREYVIEYQLANAKSLSTENFFKVPGFISAKKEPGSVYINTKTGQVHFVNDKTNIWRTTVIKSRTSLLNLANNDFHLFPNAGKK